MSKSTHVTVKIPRELIEEIDQLDGTHGFRGRGEITKQALREFLDKYNETAQPRFEQINTDENGIKIHDRRLRSVVEVYIKPTGIRCDYDQTDNCDHIHFALSLPEVQTLLKKHRREGWKV